MLFSKLCLAPKCALCRNECHIGNIFIRNINVVEHFIHCFNRLIFSRGWLNIYRVVCIMLNHKLLQDFETKIYGYLILNKYHTIRNRDWMQSQEMCQHLWYIIVYCLLLFLTKLHGNMGNIRKTANFKYDWLATQDPI